MKPTIKGEYLNLSMDGFRHMTDYSGKSKLLPRDVLYATIWLRPTPTYLNALIAVRKISLQK
jgi:hypothetical protein